MLIKEFVLKTLKFAVRGTEGEKSCELQVEG
jgi:hypothetical protein